jgi:hypothetical protein
MLLAQGKRAEARELGQKLSADRGGIPYLRTCLDHPPSGSSPSPELDQAGREFLTLALANPDSENRYVAATDFAVCGQKDFALRSLKSAVEGNYCAYAAVQRDPRLASLRSSSEFPSLLTAAKQCQDNFLAQRAQLAH